MKSSNPNPRQFAESGRSKQKRAESISNLLSKINKARRRSSRGSSGSLVGPANRNRGAVNDTAPHLNPMTKVRCCTIFTSLPPARPGAHLACGNWGISAGILKMPDSNGLMPTWEASASGQAFNRTFEPDPGLDDSSEPDGAILQRSGSPDQKTISPGKSKQ